MVRPKGMPEGAKLTQEWLAVGDLVVDERYQRPLSEQRVRRMMRNFDPDLIGSLLVSRRDDERLILLDGQQRREAVSRKWGETERVPCLVYHGLTVQQEAEIFHGFNSTQVRPALIELFNAQLVAEHPEALDIQRIVGKHHLKIARGDQPMGIQAVAGLQAVYRGGGGGVLDETLYLLVQSGMATERSLPGEIIVGLGMLLARYPWVDRKRVVRMLEDVQPRRLVSTARSLRSDVYLSTVTMPSVVSHILADYYNKNLRNRRIEWTDIPPGGPRRAWKPAGGPHDLSKRDDDGEEDVAQDHARAVRGRARVRTTRVDRPEVA